MVTSLPVRLRYGTSIWSEKSWVGPFYPPGTRPGDFLAHYATHFDTVEADNTYYAIPRQELVRGWDCKIPDGLLLSAKFPRSIVHGGEGERPDPRPACSCPTPSRGTRSASWRPWSCWDPSADRSCCSSPTSTGRPSGAWAHSWSDWSPTSNGCPAGSATGVEVRNKAWLVPELTDALRRHGVALVLVDIAYMPHPADLAEALDLIEDERGHSEA